VFLAGHTVAMVTTKMIMCSPDDWAVF